jgi:hypothetical protein
VLGMLNLKFIFFLICFYSTLRLDSCTLPVVVLLTNIDIFFLQQYVKESLAWARYVVWWVALGVASSIGLGKGFACPLSENVVPGVCWGFPMSTAFLKVVRFFLVKSLRILAVATLLLLFL